MFEIIETLKSICPKNDPNRIYFISKRLDKRSFGNMFIGHDDMNQNIIIEFQNNKREYEREVYCMKYIKENCKEGFFSYKDNFIIEVQGVCIYCIVIDYLSGYLLLDDFIEKEFPLTREIIDQIVNNIENIIKMFHGRQIEHRDIHGGNILIDPQTFQIRLVDFGKCYVHEMDGDEGVIFQPNEDHMSIQIIKRELYEFAK